MQSAKLRTLVHHDPTKHIKIGSYFIKESKKGVIQSIYIPTGQQIADMLTKELPRTRFEEICSRLGMIKIYLPTWGECRVWFPYYKGFATYYE